MPCRGFHLVVAGVGGRSYAAGDQGRLRRGSGHAGSWGGAEREGGEGAFALPGIFRSEYQVERKLRGTRRGRAMAALQCGRQMGERAHHRLLVMGSGGTMRRASKAKTLAIVFLGISSYVSPRIRSSFAGNSRMCSRSQT